MRLSIQRRLGCWLVILGSDMIARGLAAICVGIGFVSICSAAAGSSAVSQSLGGTPVDNPSDAPWSVQITMSSEGSAAAGSCSGSILDPIHVLTAAHCTFRGTAPWDTYVIRAGVTNLVPNGQQQEQVREAIGVRRHPDYVANTFNHDLAVLEVDPPFDFSNSAVGSIPVGGVGSTPAVSALVTLIGWGRTAPDTPSLQEHSLSLITLSQWRCVLGQGLPSFACQESPSGSPCGGDSGAGLVFNSPAILVATHSVVKGECRVGAPSGGPDLTTPEINAWLSGNQNPPRAPEAENFPLLSGRSNVNESIDCVGARWTGNPTLQTAFVDLQSNEVVLSGSSPRMQIPPTTLGHQIACVSIASNSGGTTEARSSNSILVSPARSLQSTRTLVTLLKRTVRKGRWHLVLRIGPPLVGLNARIAWRTRRCTPCVRKQWRPLKARLSLTSPRVLGRGPTVLRLRLPSTETDASLYRAAQLVIHLPRLRQHSATR